MAFGVICFGSFILIFGAVAAWILYTYFQQRREAEESAGWPATQGTIVLSTVKVSTTRHEDDDEIWEEISYFPKVQYEYSVMGKTYTGGRIAFGASKGFSSRAAAEKVLERYPVGETVTVYYNPNNPADAVLEREMRGGGSLLFIGLAFAFATACLLFAALLVLLPGK